MKSVLAAGIATAGLVAGLGAITPAANAASCSSKTGGKADSVSYTGKNGGNSENGYTCAYRYSSGKIKLKKWQTKSWTSNSAPGYTKRMSCYKDEKNVTVSGAYAQSTVGSSYTQTATNWDTKHTRHFGGGVLWTTDEVLGSQFDKSHCNWGDFPVNFYWPVTLGLSIVGQDLAAKTLTFQVTATALDNNPVQGGVAVYRMLGATPDPKKADGSGTDPAVAQGGFANGVATMTSAPQPVWGLKYYAATAGTDVNTEPPVRGWTPAISSTVESKAAAKTTATEGLAFSVLEDRAKAPEAPSVRCESGQRVLQVEAGSPKVSLDDAHVKIGKRKATLDPPKVEKGTKLILGAICVDQDSKVEKFGALTLGTVRADSMSMKDKGVMMAGPGNDELKLKNRAVIGYGGEGKDKFVIKAARAVASGGLGADRIESKVEKGGAMLIGGPGPDTLIGGFATDRINARDGSGGDTVKCRGKANKVLADKGDEVKGDCAWVRRD